MKYRPDIDGLRAVAIVPVLLYHLGFSIAPGGFVGVDVFFVISGYLVTGILAREMQAGKFTLSGFYERRVRRLLPAFVVMLAASTVAAVCVLLPSDLRAFAGSSIASLAVVSNFWFWRHAGYFDSSSDSNPLLHMWSLSVEEQFYIVFPILLLLIFRFCPAAKKRILLALALGSLLLSVLALPSRPTAVFYLPVFRAWELLTGCLLALLPAHAFGRVAREIGAVSGLTLILLPVALFSDKIPFPGLNALMPCLGAACLIYSGGESMAGRFLSWRPLVWIGAISYSLYLWHWPLIVFARWVLDRPFSTRESLLLLALSVLCAVVSWRYVERPFRTRPFMLSRRRLFLIAAGVMLAFAGVDGWFCATHGLSGRYDALTLALDKERTPEIPGLNCFEFDRWKASGKFCRIGDAGGPPAKILVWGDSHSLALIPALDSVFSANHVQAYYAGTSACPPLFGVENRDNKHDWHCSEYSAGVASLLDAHPEIDSVVLIAAWASYANDSGAYTLADSVGRGNEKVFRGALAKTVRALNARGVKTPVIIGQVPPQEGDLPYRMIRARLSGRPLPATRTADYSRRLATFHQDLEMLRGRCSFRAEEISTVFCGQDTCLSEVGGLPLYRDAGHLNRRGALYTVPFFEGALR